jgi:hypothetical protein
MLSFKVIIYTTIIFWEEITKEQYEYFNNNEI